MRKARRASSGPGSFCSFAWRLWPTPTCIFLQPAYPVLKHLGVLGLTVTLYLIGTGLSARTIRQVGPRPLLQGVLLWIAIASGSLALIRLGWIHL